jgi:predicted phosphodiesterase
MLAILSDVHANLPALQAVLDHARSRGCTRYLSLGDVVGYGAQPGQCIELLQALGVTNILGNHDGYVVRNEDCPRSRHVSRILAFQRSVLRPGHVDWLRRSSNLLRDGNRLFLHGGPEDPLDQYLYDVSRATLPEGVRWLFAGHTHVQAHADFGDSCFCNPGSVGQPRDGDWRAGYATFDGDRLELHRVPYDVEQAAAAMRAAGFESFYYENLFQGAQLGGRVDRITVHHA